MKLRMILLATAVLCASLVFGQETTPPPANPPKAGTKTPIVKERQKIQHHRIKEGVKSGELTKKETAKLKTEEKEIKAEKQMAKADGKVTKEERAKLRHDQNKASKDIHKMKHNDKKRPEVGAK
jgi:hypothetical protein